MQAIKCFQTHISGPVLLISALCAFSWNVVTDSIPAYKDPYTNKDIFWNIVWVFLRLGSMPINPKVSSSSYMVTNLAHNESN